VIRAEHSLIMLLTFDTMTHIAASPTLLCLQDYCLIVLYFVGFCFAFPFLKLDNVPFYFIIVVYSRKVEH